MDQVNGHAECGEDDRVPVYSIYNVPITEERKPYISSKNSRLQHAGTNKRRLRAQISPRQKNRLKAARKTTGQKSTRIKQSCNNIATSSTEIMMVFSGHKTLSSVSTA
ncbi:unnamed protein product [Alternaria alternata]